MQNQSKRKLLPVANWNPLEMQTTAVKPPKERFQYWWREAVAVAVLQKPHYISPVTLRCAEQLRSKRESTQLPVFIPLFQRSGNDCRLWRGVIGLSENFRISGRTAYAKVSVSCWPSDLLLVILTVWEKQSESKTYRMFRDSLDSSSVRSKERGTRYEIEEETFFRTKTKLISSSWKVT